MWRCDKGKKGVTDAAEGRDQGRGERVREGEQDIVQDKHFPKITDGENKRG